MKKSTIWAIAIIMGFSFVGLLWIQVSYIEEMAKMKREQFDESVTRALYQASRNLELNETLRFLEKDVNETERKAFSTVTETTNDNFGGAVQQSHQYSVAGDDGTIYSSFELRTIALSPQKMQTRWCIAYSIPPARNHCATASISSNLTKTYAANC